MWTCTPSFQTASKAFAVLRPKWSQLAVDFKRWGFRTWLKEAESRMHEAADGDLFGSDTIGEQAALDMETSSERLHEKAVAPEKLDYQAVTTEAQFAVLVGQTVAGGQNRY